MLKKVSKTARPDLDLTQDWHKIVLCSSSVGGVVAQWMGGMVLNVGRHGGSMGEARWLNGSVPDCCLAVPVRIWHLPSPPLIAHLLVGCHLGWDLAEG